jgi:hypothetical protein
MAYTCTVNLIASYETLGKNLDNFTSLLCFIVMHRTSAGSCACCQGNLPAPGKDMQAVSFHNPNLSAVTCCNGNEHASQQNIVEARTGRL